MKPILFNTEMVRAILAGRKTATRRVVKPVAMGMTYEDGSPARKPPYCPSDILYVRETWHKDAGRYMYKANYTDNEKFYMNGREVSIKWHPSIHMPREAARIFLRVTNVRVEQLQDITSDEAVDEGAVKRPNYTKRGDLVVHNRYREEFAKLWDSTIKPADRAIYGWAANPWVWVIEFERVTKEEAEDGAAQV